MDEDQKEQKTHQQHPIPQNVMGVEFKLVGGLTLRQFLFLAGFIITAWIIYSSALPSIIRTPIAITVAIFGAFISIVPIQDRSADIWLKNFLMAVSSPTERVWRKGSANLDIFFELREARSAIALQKEEGAPRDRSQLTQYLRNAEDDQITPLDLAEKEYLKSISILQNDVSLPSGMIPTVTETPAPTEESTGTVVREDVDVTPTLASEVNYSQEKVIALPRAGKQTKFVTPIQNTRTGRRIRLVRPGEIGLSIVGERNIVSVSEATQKRAEDLAGKVDEVGKKIEVAQGSGRIIQPATIPEAKPANTQSPPTNLSGEIILPPAPQTESGSNGQIRNLKSPPEPGEKLPVENLPIMNNTPQPSPAQPAASSLRQAGDRGFESGKIAYLSEELAKLKEEKQKLVDDLEKQKKARLEAETYASMAAEYQKRANEVAGQNDKLAQEMKRAQDELHRLQDVALKTTSEKELLAKQIKENERHVSELSREKSQTTDSLINMQRELRELRLKTRFAQASAAVQKDMSTKTEPPKTETLVRSKSLPFIKDAPNIINGYVRGKAGNLIKNAVIIVKDPDGSPVRALKSNELGQFAITTAVPNGSYSVEASSTSETFAIMTVDVYGTVLDPLDFVGT